MNPFETRWDRNKEYNALSKADRLIEQAERLEREAERLEGTCWEGDMSPSQSRRMEASEKREHAMLLRIHMKTLGATMNIGQMLSKQKRQAEWKAVVDEINKYNQAKLELEKTRLLAIKEGKCGVCFGFGDYLFSPGPCNACNGSGRLKQET